MYLKRSGAVSQSDLEILAQGAPRHSVLSVANKPILLSVIMLNVVAP
jgi:hypothetical protein